MLPSPLPHHQAIVEHLRRSEPGLWKWFSSTRQRESEAEAVRLELLKSTYRLEPESQPKLYELATGVLERMQLTCRVTLYQSQVGGGLNAALAYLPGEAHIIFTGPLATVLSEAEVQAVLAHELGHYLLLAEDDGVYLTASDLLRALAGDPAAGAVASESLRLFNLWTEIYADRWACHLGDDVAAIAALLKTSTGLNQVDGESYLRQAEEIFAKGDAKTDGVSHPEPYIRARALRLWVEKGDEAQAEIDRMIEGRLSLQHLDLLGQTRAAKFTQDILSCLLAPVWFRTESVMAHARNFFSDFEVVTPSPDRVTLKRVADDADDSLRDYVGYLLLDFISVDRELGDPAIAAALLLARDLGLDQRFAELIQKELGVGKKTYAKLNKDAETILAKTDHAHQS